jgi:hypothetical protein
MSVLHGEPTDGSGRVCIHLVIPDQDGPFVEPHVLYPAVDESGQVVKQRVVAKRSKCRLACDHKKTAVPSTKGNVTTVVFRTTEPAAVTCPRCVESEEYKKLTQPEQLVVSPPPARS